MGSIEEDIEIVKELLKGAKEYGQYNGNQYFYSIENILSDYTRQKQINEEHQKINGELREEVKELEDKYILEKVAKEEVEELLEDSIPKQKIKDKVEEIRHKKEEYEEKGEGLQINDFFHRKFIEATHKIRALEELLQESEENNHAK